MNTSDILGLVGKLSSLAQQPADSEAERTLQDSFSALAQAAESFFLCCFRVPIPKKASSAENLHRFCRTPGYSCATLSCTVVPGWGC